MMLKGFEHIGMAVSNLDESIAFYCDLLGMKLILRKPFPRGVGEVAFLDTGGGMGQLELICPSPPVSRPAPILPDSGAGVRHLTFAFDNIDAVWTKLMDAGVTPVEEPRDAYNKEMLARVAFVLDPDGIIVELAQRNN
jgi:glyoxylase I family protein